MRFIHRISIASSAEVRAELATMGVVVAGEGFVSFEIDESQESWPRMRQWIAARRPSDIVTTRFSEQEIADASWLELVPDWHHGYPQPDEGSFGYRAATYDLSAYCLECGVGLKQNAPFFMKSEPKWGGKEILQLNWIFDEYFVTPSLWSRIFEPFGVGFRVVLDLKGQNLDSVVQLVVEEEVGIGTNALTAQGCSTCRREKFIPLMRGRFPRLLGQPEGHIVKTKEYFGSGKLASKRVLISHELAAKMKGVRGTSLRPVDQDE